MPTKKLFSLLRPADVELRPGEKILPQEDLSTLLDSSQLLEQVQKDALEYRKKIVAETELAKQQAKQEGFELGLREWAGQMFELEKEVEKIRAEYERLIAKVAVKAAQSVVGKQLQEKPELFTDIVANTLKAVSQHRRIAIYCSRHDYELLEAQKPKLKALFEQLEILTVQVRAEMQPGGYTVETERGIINSSDAAKVWQTLETAFETQLKTGERRV